MSEQAQRDVYDATSWVYSRLADDADEWTGSRAAEIYESACAIDRRYSDPIPRLAGDAESVAHRAWSRIKSLLAGAEGGSRGDIPCPDCAPPKDGGRS